MHQALCLKLWGKHRGGRQPLRSKHDRPRGEKGRFPNVCGPGPRLCGAGQRRGWAFCALGVLLERNQGAS